MKKYNYTYDIAVVGGGPAGLATAITAARAGKRALTICTVSDSLVTGEKATVEERTTSYQEMMELALRTAVQMSKK